MDLGDPIREVEVIPDSLPVPQRQAPASPEREVEPQREAEPVPA